MAQLNAVPRVKKARVKRSVFKSAAFKSVSIPAIAPQVLRVCSARWRLAGSSMTEFLIALPAILLLGLGGMQGALMYNAKNMVNYATFEAARVGAVTNADVGAMKTELGVRLAPIFGGDGSGEKAVAGMTEGMLEARDPRYTNVQIINPTIEAFDDFGEVDESGNTYIPNNHLRHRSRIIGPTSEVTIQDANLLKIKTTYAFQLKIPFVRNVISAVLRRTDPTNAQYYLLHRIPITSVATVRMQSPAFLSDEVGSVAGGGGAVRPPEEEEEEEEDPTDGQGGNETSSQGSSSSDAGQTNPTDDIFGGGLGGNLPGVSGQGCDPAVQSCIPPNDLTDGDIQACAVPSTFEGFGENALALPSQQVGNPINVVTGNKFQKEVDIAAVKGGSQVAFKRYYNSNKADKSLTLGYGWRHNYDTQAQVHGNSLSIVQADGRRIIFTPPAANDQTAEQATRLFSITVADGEVWVGKARALRYEWRQRNGGRLWFNHQGQLVKQQNALGHTLSFTYTQANQLQQVKDTYGYTLGFDYYPNGRLKTVFDAAGQEQTYRYDHAGNLSQVKHRNGYVRQYHYEDTRHIHHLTGLTDERGVRFATWAYDDKGRGVLSEHQGDERVELVFEEGQTLVTDSLGRVTTYLTERRHGISLVTAVQGPGCDSCAKGDVTYTYTDDLQLKDTYYKNGRIEAREYDDHGRLKSLTLTSDALKAEGKRERYTQHIYANEEPAQFIDYLPAEIHTQSVNGSELSRTMLSYNAAGLPTSITRHGYSPLFDGRYQPISQQTQYYYNPANQLTHIDGPRDDVNDITALEYDEQQRLSAIVSPEGVRTHIEEYDSYGRPTFIDQGGLTTRIGYNVTGQITQLARGNRSMTYEYNGRGQRTLALEATGQYRRYGYDDVGRLNAVTDNQGNTLTQEYTRESQLSTRQYTSADGGVLSTLSYLYDIEGRLNHVNDNGSVLALNHNSAANQVLITQGNMPEGVEATADTGGQAELFIPQGEGAVAQYSPFGQLLSVRAGDITTAHYQYDNRQQLSDFTDANGNTTGYYTDDFGRTVGVVSPNSGAQWYDYDAAGNLLAQHYLAADGAANQSNHYQYNAAGQLAQATDSEGTAVLYYNDKGQLESIVKDGELSQQFTYNASGQVAKHTRIIGLQTYSTGYEYNRLGQLAVKHLANGVSLQHHYHTSGGQVGELSHITEPGLLWDSLILGDINNPSNTSTSQSLTWGNGVNQTLTRDSRGRITGISTNKGLQLVYDYDESGNIVGFSHAQPASTSPATHTQQSYEYDGAGRLSQVIEGRDFTYFQYDASGNRKQVIRTQLPIDGPKGGDSTEVEVLDAQFEIYEYEPNSDRLTAIKQSDKTAESSTTAITYNAQGSAAEYGHITYQYNSRQRPIKVFQHGELVAEYTYNTYGERTSKTVHSSQGHRTTHYLYENQRLVAEANSHGKVTHQYLYHNQRPVGAWINGEFYAVHTNHQGTPLSLTNKKQATVWQASYSAFGKAAVNDDADGNGQRITFNLRLPGQIEDPETGTHYNYLRDYNPATGRYLTSDPLGQAGGINTYLYANANPLRYSDPLGLAPMDAALNIAINGLSPNDVYVFRPMSCGGEYSEDAVQRLNQFNTFVSSITGRLDANTLHTDALGQLDRAQRYLTQQAQDGRVRNSTIDFTRPDAAIWFQNEGTLGLREFDSHITLNAEADQGQLAEIGVAFDTLGLGFSYDFQHVQINPGASNGGVATPPQIIVRDITEEEAKNYSPKDLEYVVAKNQEPYSLLAISDDADSASIRTELRTLLGATITAAELDQALATIEANRFTNEAALVNITGLYGTALARFHAELFADERVATAHTQMQDAKAKWERAGSPIVIIPDNCPAAGCFINDPIYTSMQIANKRFENTLEDVKEELVEANLYPRHENDMEIDQAEFDIAILTLEIATLFTPLEWVNVARKSVTAAKALIKASMKQSAKWAKALATKSVASTRAFEDAFAEFIYRQAVKKFDDLKASFAGYDNILKLPDETLLQLDGVVDIDALTRIDYHLGDDAFRNAVNQNPELMVQLGKRKDLRDPPSTYLSPAYIANHLAKFDDGAVRISSRSSYTKRGTLGPDGGFIMSRESFERVARESKGDKREIERLLGLDKDFLDGDIIIAAFDRKDIPDIRIPRGNEGGAHDLYWRPGGQTSGGVDEVVSDLATNKPPFTELRITPDGKILDTASLVSQSAYKTVDEFALTFDRAGTVLPQVRQQAYHYYLYKDWNKLEELFTTHKLNDGWPPAFGGYNVIKNTPIKAGEKFDRYGGSFGVDELGNPILGGSFTSPVNGAPFSYGQRALKESEESFDYYYEIEVLKDLPFNSEKGDIIPWFGHPGGGTQSRWEIPVDPATGFPKTWNKLAEEGYITLEIKASPSGKGSADVGKVLGGGAGANKRLRPFEVDGTGGVAVSRTQGFTRDKLSFETVFGDSNSFVDDVFIDVGGERVSFGVILGNREASGPSLILNNIVKVGDDFVKFKPDGFSLTDVVLEQTIGRNKAAFGVAPQSLPGELALKNLAIFQENFITAKVANPNFGTNELANIAISNTSFGQSRIKAGFSDFQFTDLPLGNVTIKSGETFSGIPTRVELEAFFKE